MATIVGMSSDFQISVVKGFLEFHLLLSPLEAIVFFSIFQGFLPLCEVRMDASGDSYAGARLSQLSSLLLAFCICPAGILHLSCWYFVFCPAPRLEASGLSYVPCTWSAKLMRKWWPEMAHLDKPLHLHSVPVDTAPVLGLMICSTSITAQCTCTCRWSICTWCTL